jgi:DNA polymerase-3 subunit delta'
MRADSHPDLHAVRLEEDAQQIKVEQVRALIDALWFKSYRGGYKVGIIERAEALNQSGANAFLKTLEEPAQNTLLIMIARPTHRLPATIASRCLKINLRAPPSTEAAAWLGQRAAAPKDWSVALKLTGGAPLAALELEPTDFATLEREMSEDLGRLRADSADITLVADRWLKTDPVLRIAWLENWITARVVGQYVPGRQSQTAEPVRLPAALLKPKMRGLFELLDAAREFRRLASTSVNQQLALEALLLGGRKVLIDAKSQ